MAVIKSKIFFEHRMAQLLLSTENMWLGLTQ